MPKVIQDVLDGHVLSLAVVVLIVVGAVESIKGDISYSDLVTQLGPIVGLTAVGRGLAAYKR